MKGSTGKGGDWTRAKEGSTEKNVGGQRQGHKKRFQEKRAQERAVQKGSAGEGPGAGKRTGPQE